MIIQCCRRQKAALSLYGTLTMEQLCLDGKEAAMMGFFLFPPDHCPSDASMIKLGHPGSGGLDPASTSLRQS